MDIVAVASKNVCLDNDLVDDVIRRKGGAGGGGKKDGHSINV